MTTNHNILVVDDEQSQSILVSELLKKAGYTVSSANDGFKALAACKVRTPDVILLDLDMPMMTGSAVFQKLKTDEKTVDIPIILMGTKGEALPQLPSEDIQQADVLLKPVEPNDLLGRVRAVLKERALKEELRKKELQVRDLTLTDPVTGLRTPRYLAEYLKIGIKQAMRYDVPLSVVLIELDDFAEASRNLGQAGSDTLAKQIAQTIARQLRESDIVVRTATFQFTVVLTVTGKEGAIEVSERLRTQLAVSNFQVDGHVETVTVSLGICEYTKQMDEEGKILISHAKAALNQAHKSGGNITLMAE